ncbi:MAG: hypothetical protein IT221_11645 [Fluviicola sp.]|nr:hypothetical protein [Fluviicola sp.]
MEAITTTSRVGDQLLCRPTVFYNDACFSAETNLQCSCGNEEQLSITPYESGFPFAQVYHFQQLISTSQLLARGMAKETAPFYQHFGAYTVNNLPTFYFKTVCDQCHQKRITVFSFGEQQPGLEVLTISGTWKLEEESSN